MSERFAAALTSFPAEATPESLPARKPAASMPPLLLVLLFALTLFASAALLFVIELMVGKTLLPMLGGTPAVWNTCMLFYQALLLAGYCYAHVSTAWLGVRRQAVLHLGVLLLPFLTLGLTMDRGLFDYGSGSPIPGLLLGLCLSVGLPFFAVSTTAPLLQKWFAGTNHPDAKDPYFLYAASNLGSMVGLFSYPILIEPWLTLADQRLLWRIGYGLLALLTAVCAVCLWRSPNPDKETKAPRGLAAESSSGLPVSLSLGRRLRWVALAFVPSSLMLGVTTYVTTDVAPVPLLWVLPLGLYLLSFILVFSRLPAWVHRFMVVLLPLLLLLLVFLMISKLPLPAVSWEIGVHLAVLFVVAMVCHGELARDRPPVRYLTGFYLWMSVGGVLGGLFNALVAPTVFNGIVEHPLALVLACLLMPTLEGEKQSRPRPALGTGLMGLFLGIGLVLFIASLSRSDLDFRGLTGLGGRWLGVALLAVLVLAATFTRGRRDDRARRWLDFGLPAALGVLAVGLNLGLPLTQVFEGFEWLYAGFHEALSSWVPTRVTRLLDLSPTGLYEVLAMALPVVICYFFVQRPLRFGLGVGALLLATSLSDLLDNAILLRARSFFGVLHVTERGDFRRLEHGTTLHGQQRLRWPRTTIAAGAANPLAASDPLCAAVLLTAGQDFLQHPGRDPQTYFHRTGPIGQVFAAYEKQLAGRHVGLIGLGSGTLASYGQPGQKLTYYEIDPLVKDIAYDPDYFTFVRDALGRGVAVDTVLGDARLKLEDRARQGLADQDKFALLIVDAFSSDAIPIHLLTRQALDVYLDNLADDGLLAFHISNRYLDLEPVLGNLAEQADLAGFVQKDRESRYLPGKAASNWVIMARHRADLDRLVHEERWGPWKAEQDWEACGEAVLMLSAFPDPGGQARAQATVCLTLFERLQAPWRRLKTRADVGVWTDDYSNLLRVFDWKN